MNKFMILINLITFDFDAFKLFNYVYIN